MKIMLTTIVGLCMVTFSGAFPQVSLETTTLPPLEPGSGCRYEDIEFTELIEKEVLEKKCHDVNKCVCIDKTEERCLTYKVDESICTESLEKECKDVTKKICDTITTKIIEQIEEEVCGPVEVRKCTKIWICENEDCSIKVWGDSDDCDTYTITECKHILRNNTVTRSIPTEKNTTIQFCESVPKTKCVISQVDKTHCTTETVEECTDKVEEKCIEIHKKVPMTVTSIKHIKKCGPAVDLGSNEIKEIMEDNKESILDVRQTVQ